MNDERRRQILRAAEALLGQCGWSKTTVAQIAKHASVGVGTVYLEFHSKDAIMSAIAEQKWRAVMRAMRRASMREQTWEDKLRATLDARTEAMLEVARCSPHAADIIYGSCEGTRRAIEAFETHQRDVLCDLIEEACAAGSFACPDPKRTTDALLCAYSQLMPPTLFALSTARRRALREALHQLILHGLRTR